MPLLASLRQPGLGEVGTGGTVWPAAVALATALLGAAAHTRERALAQRARSVLELGSGCGLCGLAAFHAAADATSSAEAVDVTLTDVAPEVGERACCRRARTRCPSRACARPAPG